MDEGVACYISLSELEEATKNFSTRIGRGSFGPVYHGKMQDGKEIAVKIMADSSSHGTQQFLTEVDLYSLFLMSKLSHPRLLILRYSRKSN